MSPLEIPAEDERPALIYPLHETRLHKLIVWLARRVLRLFMVMDIAGLEHIPATGAAVVAANHLVMFDVFPVQLALPRMVFYMGKAELFQVRAIHALFRHMGAFPVYRGERDAWALGHARTLLNAGQIVAMFPEGTRSAGRGLALAKPGAARLAIEGKCPVIVVSVAGIQDLLRTFPRRTRVNVTIAAPIYPSEQDSAISLTDRIMFTMAGNLPADLRGVYAEIPKGFDI